MTDKEIKQEVLRYADQISKELRKGRNVEIHPAAGGVKVLSVNKRIVRCENE